MTQPPADQPPENQTQDLVRRIAGVLGNVTVLTALLVYFGWRRSETQAAALGIDESILGQGTRDYLLRSIDPLFPLILGIAAIGLLWLWGDGLLVRRLNALPRSGQRWILLCLSLSWLFAPLTALIVGLAIPRAALLFFPLSIGVGFLLTAYAENLRTRLDDWPQRAGRPDWHGSLFKAFVAIVVFLSLFWTTANYARRLGEGLARGMDSRVGELTAVVLYSKERLYIEAPGVTETRLQDGKEAPTFRYGGLRLLEHVGDRYFLVSDDWTSSFGVVTVFKESDSLRFEFVRDRR